MTLKTTMLKSALLTSLTLLAAVVVTSTNRSQSSALSYRANPWPPRPAAMVSVSLPEALAAARNPESGGAWPSFLEPGDGPVELFSVPHDAAFVLTEADRLAVYFDSGTSRVELFQDLNGTQRLKLRLENEDLESQPLGVAFEPGSKVMLRCQQGKIYTELGRMRGCTVRH